MGEECPSIDHRKDGWIEVTGYLVDRDGQRIHADDTESTVEVPDHLLGELGDLAVTDLAGFIATRHRSDVLRVQTRDQYSVASDEEDFRRYVEGQPFQVSEARRAWADKLRADRAEGRLRRNVHVVTEPLTLYLRYQLDWGYRFNADAGMDIRIAATSDTPATAHLRHVGDFTVVEHKEVVRNRYNDSGEFLGAVQASADAAPAYTALAELVWEQAVPFAEWWAGRPQYHRRPQAA